MHPTSLKKIMVCAANIYQFSIYGVVVLKQRCYLCGWNKQKTVDLTLLFLSHITEV